jgi:hypothetical protein
MSNKTLHILALAGVMLVLGPVNVSLGGPEIRFMPVAVDGNVVCMPGDGACGETEIMLAQGGVEVTLFVEISGWDYGAHPGDPNWFLGGYTATLDLTTLEGGDDSGVDTMPGFDLTLVGTGSGDWSEGAFTALRVCGTEQCLSDPGACDWDRLSNCNPWAPPGECPDPFPHCVDRPDFILSGPLVPSITPVILPPHWAGEAYPSNCREDPRDGSRFYAGTLLLDVPPGAQGTYNVNSVADPNFTALYSCPGPPFPGVSLTPGKITLPPLHSVRKHRYLSINPDVYGPDSGAYRVDLVSMKRCSGNLERACTFDSDCEEAIEGSGTCVEHPHVGGSWWVQEPHQEPLGCPPDNVCAPDDYLARLGDTPFFTEWTQPWLHIGDCEVTPLATYEIRWCLPPDGMVCDEPLIVGTVAQSFMNPGFRGNYGDIAGAPHFAGAPFGPPDGYANVTDVMAVLFTMYNLGTDNQPQAHPTWVDLHGLGDGIPPNYIINVTDLQLLLKGVGLIAGHWTDFGGALNPGDCP